MAFYRFSVPEGPESAAESLSQDRASWPQLSCFLASTIKNGLLPHGKRPK